MHTPQPWSGASCVSPPEFCYCSCCCLDAAEETDQFRPVQTTVKVCLMAFKWRAFCRFRPPLVEPFGTDTQQPHSCFTRTPAPPDVIYWPGLVQVPTILRQLHSLLPRNGNFNRHFSFFEADRTRCLILLGTEIHFHSVVLGVLLQLDVKKN